MDWQTPSEWQIPSGQRRLRFRQISKLAFLQKEEKRIQAEPESPLKSQLSVLGLLPLISTQQVLVGEIVGSSQ